MLTSKRRRRPALPIRRRPTPLLLLLLAGLLLGGCRSHRGLQEAYARVLRPAALRGDWGSAAEALEKERGDTYREEDRVLFWLEQGTVLHYAGENEASSRAFFAAEEEMQRLFTKSISEEVGRFVATETVQTYAGEDHERILTYLYTAMNAARDGRIQDALVEARRADEFLKEMQIRAERAGAPSVYTQDAFMLWWVGLFREIEGSFDDAFLAYRSAYEVYQGLYRSRFGTAVPPWLAEDVVRAALLAGRESDAARWRERTGATGETAERLRRGGAEVILVHGSGEAPAKREKTFTALVPDGYVVRVAIPELVPRPSRVTASRLVVGDARARAVVAEPVEAIALTRFREEEPALRARAIARAAIKYAATKASSEAIKGDRKDEGRRLAGALVGLIGNIAAAASEGADLRSWNLLPAEFRVARLWVAPGAHRVRVELLDRAGREQGVLLEAEIELVPNERRLLSVRSLR